MALDSKRYTSTLWSRIQDPIIREAMRDLAQKTVQLSQDADTFPKGAIVFWLGSRSSIPAGWSEYTGLQGRFPRGALSSGTPGTTGGSDTHTHGTGGTQTGGGSTLQSGGTGTGYSMNNGTGAAQTLASYPHKHDIEQTTTLPPYVDGVWIIKN